MVAALSTVPASSSSSCPIPIPPSKTQVLVVGGGPAGSYTATALSREGFQVTLLEAAKFPRYHVGEGMLPSMRHFLRFIDLEDKFHNHGFMHKPGSCFKLNHDKRETYTDFCGMGPGMATWNVIRAESDDLMLRHASEQGVCVVEETRISSIEFSQSTLSNASPQNLPHQTSDTTPSSRPISASWINKHGQSGSIAFDWLVDATGRAGLMSTKYLKNRTIRDGLKNVAVWGYWRNVRIYKEGTSRANAPWIEAMTDEQGWAWLIPLHDGTTSIGFVMHQNVSNSKKTNLSKSTGSNSTLVMHYLDQIKLVPGVCDLIGDQGHMVENSVKSSSDHSYFASNYAGDHYRIVGDAAAFVDPFFSSGVHLALTGALSAAVTISASLRGDVTEDIARRWHDTKMGMCHTRFLLVVLGAYKQMQQQSKPILADVNAESFDAVFDVFWPVIFGTSDTAPRLTDVALNEALDFCVRLFEPLEDADEEAIIRRIQPDLLSIAAPVTGPADWERAVGPGDRDAKRILGRKNALKIFKNDVTTKTFAADAVEGYVVRLERGNLGLVGVQ